MGGRAWCRRHEGGRPDRLPLEVLEVLAARGLCLRLSPTPQASLESERPATSDKSDLNLMRSPT